MKNSSNIKNNNTIYYDDIKIVTWYNYEAGSFIEMVKPDLSKDKFGLPQNLIFFIKRDELVNKTLLNDTVNEDVKRNYFNEIINILDNPPSPSQVIPLMSVKPTVNNRQISNDYYYQRNIAQNNARYSDAGQHDKINNILMGGKRSSRRQSKRKNKSTKRTKRRRSTRKRAHKKR